MDIPKALEGFDSKTRQEVVDTLNRLRDCVLYAAGQIEDPRQLERYLDGLHSLADGIASMDAVNQRPVDRTITMIREAAANIGFNKLMTRRGRQERPED